MLYCWVIRSFASLLEQSQPHGSEVTKQLTKVLLLTLRMVSPAPPVGPVCGAHTLMKELEELRLHLDVSPSGERGGESSACGGGGAGGGRVWLKVDPWARPMSSTSRWHNGSAALLLLAQHLRDLISISKGDAHAHTNTHRHKCRPTQFFFIASLAGRGSVQSAQNVSAHM